MDAPMRSMCAGSKGAMGVPSNSMPPRGEIRMFADGSLEIGRPIHHGKETLRGRQAQPHDRGRRQLTALDDGIREMRRADHHHADLDGRDAGLLAPGAAPRSNRR
jgi:hypothetical protein